MRRRRRNPHRSDPSPYISSRKALCADPNERFIRGWDHELSNDQGISRVIQRMTNVDDRSTKVTAAGGMPTRVIGHISGKRLVPRGGKGTGRRI